MKLFTHRKHKTPSGPRLVSGFNDGSGGESLPPPPEVWVLACRIYVPVAARRRAVGGVVIEFSAEGVIVVAADSIGRYDQDVQVEFGLSSEQELVPCRVLSREQLHTRVNVFELGFSLEDAEREELVRRLVKSTLPFNPRTEQLAREAA